MSEAFIAAHDCVGSSLMTINRTKSASPALLIAIGLVLLVAHASGLAMPVATGLALVAFGATMETIARVSHMNSSPFVLVANLCGYMSLYLLLIGAIRDASLRAPRGGLTLLQGVDIGVGALAMTLVVGACVGAIIKDGDVSV